MVPAALARERKERALDTTQEPQRRRIRPSLTATKAALTGTAGLLLAAGLSMTPAQAAVTAAAPQAIQPATLGTCQPGKTVSDGLGSTTSSIDEFYGWCGGTKTTSYRAFAFCTNGRAILGVVRYDGDPRGSFASCGSTDNYHADLGSLDGTGLAYGFVLCSDNTGAGTYQGYKDQGSNKTSFSTMAINWAAVTNGDNFLCDYAVDGEAGVDPGVAP